MKLWMSGELQSDIADDYSVLRNQIEATVNSALSSKDYGPGLCEWAFIAMILNKDLLLSYKEVKRFRKKQKECEFRLIIDHDEFKLGDDAARTQMICQSLHRSLCLLREMKIPETDVSALLADFERVMVDAGWQK